jgi:hypothetical protein
MHLRPILLIALCATPARAQPPPVAAHLSYEVYAAGLNVAQAQAGFGLGPFTYQMTLAYHTTGMVGLFYQGHQYDTVYGVWNGVVPAPNRYFGHGVWHAKDRIAEIEYEKGEPRIRQLVPPNSEEREVVPEELRLNTIDGISALAELIRTVDATGRCEALVHTYDGRRASEIRSVTVGEEDLPRTSRSVFAGKALRCDFAGHLLAGFLFTDNKERESKPLHGSAWLAPVALGGPAVPVRMSFETRWFGDATMYLTAAASGAELDVPPEMR